ncbi:hypothetical protein HK104_002919, partial [Borealophlyctis nickersoniae]
MAHIGPLLAVSIGLCVAIIIWATWRIIVLYKEWRSGPNPSAAKFKKLVLSVLATYWISIVIAVIYKSMQVACFRDGPGTCGWLTVDQTVDLHRGMFYATDFFLFLSGLIYLFTVFERYMVFKPVLQFPHWLVPTLRTYSVLICIIGFASDVANDYFTRHRIALGMTVTVVGLASFWLTVIIADIWISIVMVTTFLRIHRVLNSSEQSKNSMSGSSSSMGKYVTPRIGGGDDDPLPDPKKEGRLLMSLLGCMIALDVGALLSFALTAVINDFWRFELSMISESWIGMHYLVGVYFLSRFKASMLVRSANSKQNRYQNPVNRPPTSPTSSYPVTPTSSYTVN